MEAASIVAAELGRGLFAVDGAPLAALPPARAAAALARAASAASAAAAVLCIDAADDLLAQPVTAAAVAAVAGALPAGLALVTTRDSATATTWAASHRARAIAFRYPDAPSRRAAWRDALRSRPGVRLGPGVDVTALAATRLSPASITAAATRAMDTAAGRGGVLRGCVTADDLAREVAREVKGGGGA